MRLDWDSRYLAFRDAVSGLPVPESAEGQAVAEELGAAVGSLNTLKEAQAMEVRPSPTVGSRSPTGLQLPEAYAEFEMRWSRGRSALLDRLHEYGVSMGELGVQAEPGARPSPPAPQP